MFRYDLGATGPSRRMLLTAGAGLVLAGPAFAAGHAPAAGPTPDQAMKRLMDGNARYVVGRLTHPDLDAARRKSLSGGQQPFAVILGCADSRVPPELIFDQGLGDLFDIRVAGNVVDDAVMGSVEYAVVHLGTPLIMVLGHERCGAVTATLAALDGKGSAEDRETKIGALAELIMPAAKAVPRNAPDRLDAAVVLNARRSATRLLSSAPLHERIKAGKLMIVSARYDLDDGKVTEVQKA